MTITDAHVGGGVEVGGSGSPSFTHGSDPTLSEIIVECDLDNDGDFDEPEENWTAYLLSGESVTGRDRPSPVTGLAVAGSLRLNLNNESNLFSRYDTSSPLNTAPFSLQPGRKIRVRTAESVPNDPVLLARDRFDRPDGALGSTETGQTWTNQQGSFTVAGQVASPSDDFSTIIVSTINVGVTDYYVQGTIRQTQPAIPYLKAAGLVVCWTDINNFIYVHYQTNARTLRIWRWSGGVLNAIGPTYAVEAWEGMVIGAGVVGPTVTAYVGGAPVLSGAHGLAASSHVGIFGFHDQYSGHSPEVGDFHVWDHIVGEVEGILWTGTVSDVQSTANIGAGRVAQVTGTGVLANVARAGTIASPRLVRAGARTGLIVGDILHRAGTLHPPAEIDVGTVTTGPVGIADAPALDLARQAEETERGFLCESNEGHVVFLDAAARAGAAPVVWFGDTAGQFGYHDIAPLDEKANVVNRVIGGVAPDSPSGITTTIVVGTGNVDITLPTVNNGDLLILFIASSANTAGERWLVPLFWQSHRDAGTATGLRVYSHWCNGTEGGSTVIFYANGGGAAGLFIAAIVRVEGWYQSTRGIVMGDVVAGHDPGALVHGWGRAPTLFIATASAITSSTGLSHSSDFDPPDGYDPSDGGVVTTGTPATEAALLICQKIDATESEDPTPFVGLAGGLINESVVFAVRGYNGPHTKATLANPNTVGGDGRFVTVDDVASQDAHNAVLPHRTPSNLHATVAAAEAYGEGLLAAAADARPPVSMSFWAMRSAAHRAQAVRRRVGHMIHLTANGPTTALGIDDDMFIETIGHRWSEGGCKWETTWLLSPG